MYIFIHAARGNLPTLFFRFVESQSPIMDCEIVKEMFAYDWFGEEENHKTVADEMRKLIMIKKDESLFYQILLTIFIIILLVYICSH